MGTPLDPERFISLETFKKSGAGVKTPVWTAPLDGKLVVFTAGSSWKVKRLRNNNKIRVGATRADARAGGDRARVRRARRALRRRRRAARRGGLRVAGARRARPRAERRRPRCLHALLRVPRRHRRVPPLRGGARRREAAS